MRPVDRWRNRAACRDAEHPDDWFPTTGERSAPAQKVCAGCPVSEECLEYALAHHEEHGIWGGLTARERRRVRSARARAARRKTA